MANLLDFGFVLKHDKMARGMPEETKLLIKKLQ